MPLKKSHGNMYPWVTHMHSHLGGECPHKCGYCYVQTNPHGVAARWKGKPRLIKDELEVRYGTGKTIFIEHMDDLFAVGIEDNLIYPILAHCRTYPRNTYVFQSKNPGRASIFLSLFPSDFMMGTTIETNRIYEDTNAPESKDRYRGMLYFRKSHIKIPTFVTLEPIMDFDLDVLAGWLKEINPSFINIGADSKRCGLPEPPRAKIQALINELRTSTEIKIKSNLDRVTGETEGKRICPRCKRPLDEDEVLMSLEHRGQKTGKFCSRCLKDIRKMLKR